ncbi:beta-hexosaminidase [Hyphomicrobium nitrativorans NL23]|uniref:beta-N-acetylhexosaminidase n=1 Tax=Hyphomicrobium nitrativorans NL23 TaxID=1029756 RepID=V5SDH1_9HYPH|nr:beta-N-acetylhexosaminidase [Hyphomicrobium nitrativorans]AHB48578.1 beta-hexosaminidase [Hyphomicrobium nitrativorans NL23]
MTSAFITGLAGATLTPDEASFIKAAAPAGIILFARNCVEPEQIRRLVGDAREASGHGDDFLVLIDQEGGRVQRLRPPLGRALPPAYAYACLYCNDEDGALDAAFLSARLLADDLKALGINTNCAPVLDVPVPGAHDIIGDRAYGQMPDQVARLGRAVAEGFMAGGVLPVIKHIPGHGRATADSHLALPVVDAPREVLDATDFAPFKALADMPAAMTAHVVFTAVDGGAPASTSRRVTEEVIRGAIGFDGLLMSDDLSMKALTGPLGARAEAVLAAGSDLALHCSGDFAEMEAVAAAVPALSGDALRRFRAALEIFARSEPYDSGRAQTGLARALGTTGRAPESV